MVKKAVIWTLSVVAVLAVAAGLGVLIWWLVTRSDDKFTVVELTGDGIGDLKYTAALTKIHDVGDMFWWFYPTVAANSETRPLIVWVGGPIGVPPSLQANLGMLGPYDINFNKRDESWIDQYNLLFIDAPLGTGFSTPLANSKIPTDIKEHAEHLETTLESFYSIHEEYKSAPLYIFGQGDAARLAVTFASGPGAHDLGFNLRGVVLGNGIISPAQVMTKLGFYLEELGYIDGNGRAAIETLSNNTAELVKNNEFEKAFDNFVSLGQFVNDNAGAVAVNLNRIVEKQTRGTSRDYFGEREYLRSSLNADLKIMDSVLAPALGVPSTITYDAGRDDVIEAFKIQFMNPITADVEYILKDTNISVTIYNGNLDAVSNTPGQLEWVNNLQWFGQAEFEASPRETLVVNRLVEGYFRETPKLKFYWMNAAGQSVPLDSPAAMKAILPRILVN